MVVAMTSSSSTIRIRMHVKHSEILGSQTAAESETDSGRRVGTG
jgi:hypothetical protein